MFTGRHGLKKIVFLVCMFTPLVAFQRTASLLLCMLGVSIAHARMTVKNRGKKQTSGNFISDLSKRNCHISAAEDTYAHMLQPCSCFFVPLRVTAVVLWLFASQRLWPRLCVHCACDRHMTRRHGALEYMEHLSLYSLPR